MAGGMTDHNADEIEQIRRELSRLETALEQRAEWRSLRRIEGILSDSDSAAGHYWETECNRLRAVLAASEDYGRTLELRRTLSELVKKPKKAAPAADTHTTETGTAQSEKDASSVSVVGLSDLVAVAARSIVESTLNLPLNGGGAQSPYAAESETASGPDLDQKSARDTTPVEEARPLVAELLARNAAIDNTRVKIHAHPPGAKQTHRRAKGEPDDLTRIRSIDRQLARRLIELGVTRYDEIASWSAQDVRSISAALGLERRISRQNWIEQAALLAQKAQNVSAASTMPAAPAQPASPPRQMQAVRVPRPQPQLAAQGQTFSSNIADPSAMVSNALGWAWSQACLQGEHAPVRVDPPSGQVSENFAQAAEPEGNTNAAETPSSPGEIVSHTAAAIARSLDTHATTDDDVGELIEDADPGDATGNSSGPDSSQNGMEQGAVEPELVDTASPPCFAHALEVAAQSQPDETAATIHDDSTQVSADAPIEAEVLGAVATSNPADATPIDDVAITSAVVAAGAAPISDETSSATDDLQLISAIDKSLAARLSELGVRRFAQIAGWNIHDMAKVAINLRLGSRPWREGWVEQASILANGGKTQYSIRSERGDQRALIPPPEADQAVDPGFAAWLRETAEAPVKPQPPRRRPAAPPRPRIADVLGETIATRQRRQHNAPLVPPPIPQPKLEHPAPKVPVAQAPVAPPDYDAPLQRVPVNPAADGIEVSDEPTEPSQVSEHDGSTELPPAAFEVAEAEVLIVPRAGSESDSGSGDDTGSVTAANSSPAAEPDSDDDGFPGSTILPGGELRRRKTSLNDPFKPRTAAETAYGGHNGQALDDVDLTADQAGFEVEEASVQIIRDEPVSTSSTTPKSPADRPDSADR